jgi:uncharacterized protein
MKGPEERTYRTRMVRRSLVSFRVEVEETDLMVLAAQDLNSQTRELIYQNRFQLERYIARHPNFLTTLTPWPDDPFAPALVREMIRAGARVGVGPMAAVAGIIAEKVGKELMTLSPEVIVENGGDIFLALQDEATIALFAGHSPLSMKVGIKIKPEHTPLGICTSSATVGHSLSFGRADAACVLAPTACLADAAATALGNRAADQSSIAAALEWISQVPDIWGAVLIVGDKLGAWGQVELVPL